MSETHRFHEIRAQIATDGAKALLFINGGGIVALLGFLSTVWAAKEADLIIAILQGIWLLALALVSAAANYYFRYWASTTFQREWKIRHWIFWTLEWLSILVSFSIFLFALSTVVSGARNVISA